MNQLTLDLIKLAFLAVLWLFVIAAVGVVRTDLFDQPASPRSQRRAARQAARHNQAPGPVRQPRPAGYAQLWSNVPAGFHHTTLERLAAANEERQRATLYGPLRIGSGYSRAQ